MKLKGTGYVPGYSLGKINHYDQDVPNDNTSRIVLVNEPNIEKIITLTDFSPSGIIVVGSQYFSHSLIYLFSLGIPTVLIDLDQAKVLYQNSDVFINGNSGIIYVNPNKNETHQFNNLEVDDTIHIADTQTIIRTQDGISIKLLASINSEKGANETVNYGGNGIGLLRSELLFVRENESPSFSLIYEKIKKICESAKPLPITIRLFDLGGEKVFRWVPRVPDIGLTLGVRGSRLYSFNEFSELLTNQLSAISELVDSYDISVLIPFLSSIDDLETIIEKISKIIPREKINIGAMLETASMSLSIPEIAHKVDFLAIGTNDLSQSFFGVDRSSSLASRYFDIYSPSLLRLFSIIGTDALNCNIDIRICGQLPLFPYWIQLLIGMGFREFSIEPSAIPTMKRLIKRLKVSKLRNIAREAGGILSKDRLNDFLRNEL